MSKKNQDSTYTSTTQTATTGNQGIVLDTKAIVTGVSTALVMGGIVGAFGFSRLTESNTYRITTLTQAIEDMEKEHVRKEVYDSDQKLIIYKLDQIMAALEK